MLPLGHCSFALLTEMKIGQQASNEQSLFRFLSVDVDMVRCDVGSDGERGL